MLSSEIILNFFAAFADQGFPPLYPPAFSPFPGTDFPLFPLFTLPKGPESGPFAPFPPFSTSPRHQQAFIFPASTFPHYPQSYPQKKAEKALFYRPSVENRGLQEKLSTICRVKVSTIRSLSTFETFYLILYTHSSLFLHIFPAGWPVHRPSRSSSVSARRTHHFLTASLFSIKLTQPIGV